MAMNAVSHDRHSCTRGYRPSPVSISHSAGAGGPQLSSRTPSGKGETYGGVTTGDNHKASHSQHRLSDQVSANTLKSKSDSSLASGSRAIADLVFD